MKNLTLGQIKKELPVSVDTFKRWEREMRIPCARRIQKGTTKVRAFSNEEAEAFVALILDVMEGSQPAFDEKRDWSWSPFPLPHGRPVS